MHMHMHIHMHMHMHTHMHMHMHTHMHMQTLDDPELASLIGDAELYDALLEEVEMLRELTPEIDMAAVGRGEMTPVFFGSAMTNFGDDAVCVGWVWRRVLDGT